MTGLEKMIRQIEEEAENTAASIIREAEEEAAALCREAEQSCAGRRRKRRGRRGQRRFFGKPAPEREWKTGRGNCS